MQCYVLLPGACDQFRFKIIAFGTISHSCSILVLCFPIYINRAWAKHSWWGGFQFIHFRTLSSGKLSAVYVVHFNLHLFLCPFVRPAPDRLLHLFVLVRRLAFQVEEA